MRRWARAVGVGALAGLLVGVVIGGTVGRIFMRILFLAEESNRGFETAMGAVIGGLTSGGTAFIYIFGGFTGVLLGLAYAVGRALLPSRVAFRVAVFTLGTTAFMLGTIVRTNLEDFALLPVTLSLLLIVASVAVTAAPVPLLVERWAPDPDRTPGGAARAVAVLSIAGTLVFGISGIVLAYSEPRLF